MLIFICLRFFCIYR